MPGGQLWSEASLYTGRNYCRDMCVTLSTHREGCRIPEHTHHVSQDNAIFMIFFSLIQMSSSLLPVLSTTPEMHEDSLEMHEDNLEMHEDSLET